MQIQSGKLYENRTWKYLYPCLKHYGTQLMDYLGSFFKLGVGISDSNFKVKDNCIFILLDTTVKHISSTELEIYKRRFSKFLNWLQYQDYYVTDYVYSGLDTIEKHMIVLKIPNIHDKAFNNFMEGKYSEMYTQQEKNKYFTIVENKANNPNINIRNERVKNVLLILNKDKTILPKFVNQVNKEFKTNITVEDFKDAELDFPIILSEEVFNYKEV